MSACLLLSSPFLLMRGKTSANDPCAPPMVNKFLFARARFGIITANKSLQEPPSLSGSSEKMAATLLLGGHLEGEGTWVSRPFHHQHDYATRHLM